MLYQMRTTNNFARGNRLLSWYVGGLNYQIEHHLFPRVCHVHYRQLSPIVESLASEARRALPQLADALAGDPLALPHAEALRRSRLRSRRRETSSSGRTRCEAEPGRTAERSASRRRSQLGSAHRAHGIAASAQEGDRLSRFAGVVVADGGNAAVSGHRGVRHESRTVATAGTAPAGLCVTTPRPGCG